MDQSTAGVQLQVSYEHHVERLPLPFLPYTDAASLQAESIKNAPEPNPTAQSSLFIHVLANENETRARGSWPRK